nr:universal stress protein [Luteimicrobium album]
MAAHDDLAAPRGVGLDPAGRGLGRVGTHQAPRHRARRAPRPARGPRATGRRARTPSPGLLGVAEGAERLVVGARGLGGFERLVLGSVSRQVLEAAPCPVTVVRG